MAIDVKFRTYHSTKSQYNGEIFLKVEKWQYLINRNLKIYDFPILKSVSDAMGSKTFGSFTTDFGQAYETVQLEGVVDQGGPTIAQRLINNRTRMMEISYFVRQKAFNAEQCFLYLGNEFNNKTPLNDRLNIDATDNGMEGKIDKFQFEWNKGYKLKFVAQFQVAYDFEIN